jgi:probable HAF family extracellular repeat protein
MKRGLIPSIAISTSALLLFNASNSTACQTGSGTISGLQDGSQLIYQGFSLNQSGQFTGFFYNPTVTLPHAMRYSNGSRVDLGTLGGFTSEGHSINLSGQIVGAADLADNTSHAFLVNNGGTLQDLGTLGGASSTATAINDNGVIIGDSDLAGGGTSAFIITNGVMTSLGNLGANYSSAFALNNNALVVGQSSVASGGTNAFAYFNGVLSNLGTLGGDYSAAFAVNDTGEIVGESTVNGTDTHGFVYVGGTMTDVATLGGTFSTAYLVNSASQAVGLSSTADDVEYHGFVYANGTMTDLGTLGGPVSLPNAINSKGQIVGESFTDTGVDRAFLWEKGTLTDLNTLLPANSGWELQSALFINDAGRIVGVGTSNNVPQWFIMDLAGANTAPAAVAGPDQTVDCQGQANLDGSGSTDPDNDPLTYQWSFNGSVLGTTAKLNVSLPLGTNVVTLNVTDTCGASATASLTVTVADSTPPSGSCPAAVTASADSTCQAAVPNLTGQINATDNCTPASSIDISQNPPAGTLVGLGPHSVVITVKDNSGNASTCTVLFTVQDATAPTITGMPEPFTVSVGSDCQAHVPNILGSFTATDSCTPANLLIKSQNPVAGTLIGVGSYQMTVTVKDASGNESIAHLSFNVADTTVPAILGGLDSRTVSTDAQCQGTVPNVLAGLLVSDNCTAANQLVMFQNPAAGTKLPAGSSLIVVTIVDVAGNTNSATVPLKIVDTTAPVFQTLSVTPNVLSPPNNKLVSVTVSAVVNDNCDAAPVTKIVSITCNEPTAPSDIKITGNLTAQLAAIKPSSGNTRIYTITVKSTDASGNSSTAQVTVTVPKTANGH